MNTPKKTVADEVYAVKLQFIVHEFFIFAAITTALYCASQSATPVFGLLSGVVAAVIALELEKLHENVTDWAETRLKADDD